MEGELARLMSCNITLCQKLEGIRRKPSAHVLYDYSHGGNSGMMIGLPISPLLINNMKSLLCYVAC